MTNKKVEISILLSLCVMVVILYQVQNGSKDSILSYYCDGQANIRSICYINIKRDVEEKTFQAHDSYIIAWRSSKEVLLNKNIISGNSMTNEYYLLNLKTNAMECITCKLHLSSRKELSPSTQKVAVYENQDLYIVDLNTSQRINIGQFDKSISEITWSPDESYIIFIYKSSHLYRFDLHTHVLNELEIASPRRQIFDIKPNLKGDKIGFYFLDENSSLFLASIFSDGDNFSKLVNLTPETRKVLGSENAGTFFAWSPDGNRIAFTREVENQYPPKDNIFMIELNGSKPILIDSSPTEKWSLSWDTESSLLSFVGKQYGELPDIWTIKADGSNLKNITNTPTRSEFGPTWN